MPGRSLIEEESLPARGLRQQFRSADGAAPPPWPCTTEIPSSFASWWHTQPWGFARRRARGVPPCISFITCILSRAGSRAGLGQFTHRPSRMRC